MVNDETEGNAKYIIEESIKPLDALHLASASYESADYFCTSDKNLGDYAFFGPSVKFTWLCLKT